MDIFLARQPIFDYNQNVYAYEILYRSGLVNAYDEIDGDVASREVLYNSFQTFGIETLTNGKPVFINFTEELINYEIATLFPTDLLVVEILEDIDPKEEVVASGKSLKEKGYKIALDDFIYSEEYESLIELADIIKIDFLISDRDEIQRVSKDLINRNIILLAEKVETREEFEFAKALGFTLFQGYFFSKPEILKSKKLKPIKAMSLQLINEVNQPEINFVNLTSIISRDLSLTYNLLKLVNTAAFGFRHRIKSVRHGLVALGEKEIKKWIYLVVVRDMGEDKPNELIRLSLIRGRFGELLIKDTKIKQQSENIFLIGMFSLLDVILSKPMEVILEEIQAPDSVKQALLDENGDLINLYKLIIAYEKAEWDSVISYAEELKIDWQLISMSYMESLIWYNKLIQTRI